MDTTCVLCCLLTKLGTSGTKSIQGAFCSHIALIVSGTNDLTTWISFYLPVGTIDTDLTKLGVFANDFVLNILSQGIQAQSLVHIGLEIVIHGDFFLGLACFRSDGLLHLVPGL